MTIKRLGGARDNRAAGNREGLLFALPTSPLVPALTSRPAQSGRTSSPGRLGSAPLCSSRLVARQAGLPAAAARLKLAAPAREQWRARICRRAALGPAGWRRVRKPWSRPPAGVRSKPRNQFKYSRRPTIDKVGLLQVVCARAGGRKRTGAGRGPIPSARISPPPPFFCARLQSARFGISWRPNCRPAWRRWRHIKWPPARPPAQAGRLIQFAHSRTSFPRPRWKWRPKLAIKSGRQQKHPAGRAFNVAARRPSRRGAELNPVRAGGREPRMASQRVKSRKWSANSLGPNELASAFWFGIQFVASCRIGVRVFVGPHARAAPLCINGHRFSFYITGARTCRCKQSPSWARVSSRAATMLRICAFSNAINLIYRRGRVVGANMRASERAEMIESPPARPASRLSDRSPSLHSVQADSSRFHSRPNPAQCATQCNPIQFN